MASEADAHEGSLPPEAAVLSFVDSINRRDLDALVRLMAPHHELRVLDEPPVVGRKANRKAWRGYFDAFPAYVIYPERIAQRGRQVAILGSTTGSHLDLPDVEERQLPVIWCAWVSAGLLDSWTIIADSPAARAELSLGN